MPPPLELSEEESAGESVPFKAPQQDAGNNDVVNNGNTGEESGSEDDEDLYIVEKVVDHKWMSGGLFLKVKWKGYDEDKDHTMEPEQNLLEDAKEAVDEYYEKIGGRPEKGGKKRKSAGAAGAAAEMPAKKPRKSGGEATPETSGEGFDSWHPKGKIWEKDVLSVDTIIRDDEHEDKLYGCVTWTNHKKSKVPLRECYDKLPQKMLQFYEQHLVFKST